MKKLYIAWKKQTVNQCQTFLSVHTKKETLGYLEGRLDRSYEHLF